MPQYVVLLNFTDQLFKNTSQVSELLNRRDAAYAKLGVKVVGELYTLGQYDGVMILEAPDDATVTKALLGTGQRGYVRTTSLKGVSREEFIQLAAASTP
jgi:uncharacterized protein with GYD domain